MNEQATMMNQQAQQHSQPQVMNMNMNQSMMTMNQINPQPQPQMVPMSNRSYGMWAPPVPPQFQNLSAGAMKPPKPGFNKMLGPRSNWKGKKMNNKTNDKRRKELPKSLMAGSSTSGIGGGVNLVGGSVGGPNFNNHHPPTLNELQHQNRLKERKFFGKKKFHKNNSGVNMNVGGGYYNSINNSRSAPYAPRNTTSFIIRAKKSGGIASLVSPSPMTPAVLPTPIFSPSREVLVDMAKEEWGVDGYGSMKGLIRLRSSGHEMEAPEDEDDDEGGSSESDVEEHVEVERRLDHDLSRFEMIYDPNNVGVGGMEYHNLLENRVDDQDSHIAQLEEENLILKERLFLMERELGDLRRRMQFLERRENGGDEINEEVLENDSENDSGSRGGEVRSMEDNNGDFDEDNVNGAESSEGKDNDNRDNAEGFEAAAITDKEVVPDVGKNVENHDDVPGEVNNSNMTFENHDDVAGEVNKSSNMTEGEDKEVNTNDQFIDANKAEDIVENTDDENECLGLEVEATDDVDIKSSEPGIVGGDTSMEEIGATKDDSV